VKISVPTSCPYPDSVSVKIIVFLRRRQVVCAPWSEPWPIILPSNHSAVESFCRRRSGGGQTTGWLVDRMIAFRPTSNRSIQAACLRRGRRHFSSPYYLATLVILAVQLFRPAENPRVFAKATGFSRRRQVVCAPSRATGGLAFWSMALPCYVRGGNGHEKARRDTKKSSCDFSRLFVAAFCVSLFRCILHTSFLPDSGRM